ncbi:hypothetical protein [Nocardia suismassiliense]|uniref:hypothetical protein n=1 Tax=Nocardia suismassiliense TaxID=2077092 RepID=UPI000D1DEC36|nr:hypothetical protein [Nocardia suismassiliense]
MLSAFLLLAALIGLFEGIRTRSVKSGLKSYWLVLLWLAKFLCVIALAFLGAIAVGIGSS